MKVVVVGQRSCPSYKDKYLGGVEKVEAEHLKLLAMGGHEVHFITNTDSEDREQVFVHRVGYSKLYLQGSRGNPNRNSVIREKILSIQPDVVIVHDFYANSLCSKLENIGFPTTTIMHTPIFIGKGKGILTPGYLKHLSNLVSKGHSVACVTECSRQNWNNYLISNKGYLSKIGMPLEHIEGGLFGSVLHNYVLWEKPELLETEKGFISIGRLTEQKRHLVGLEVCKELQIYAPEPSDPDTKAYHQKIIDIGCKDNLHFNIPYKELMQDLAKSSAMLCFSYESFGIVAVEANTFGVPVILQHPSENHAIEEACNPTKEVGGIIRLGGKKEDLEEFISSFKPYTKEQKQKILDKTWDYYNYKSSLSRLESHLKYVIKRYSETEQESYPVFEMFKG